MKRFIALTSGALLAFYFTAGEPLQSDAAATMTESAWDAFVASTDVGRCFPGEIPTFGKHPAAPGNAAWSRASDVGAIHLKANIQDAIGSKPLKTKVVLATPDFAGSTMSVERRGPFVAFHLEQPGGDQYGWFPATNVPGAIASSPALPFANAIVPGVSGGYLKCGMTLMTATVKNDESERGIIVRRGRLVGGFEAEGG